MSKKGYFSIFIFFVIISLVFTYPLLLNLKTKLIGNGFDNYQYVLYQYLAFKNITQFKFPFAFNNVIRYPLGFNFSYGSDSVFIILIGALLNFLTNFVTAYNLSLVFGYVLNGFCSYFLFLLLSKSKLIGLIGSIIYGYSFYSLARGAGHPNLMITGGFPLFLFSILNLKQRQKLIDFALIFFSILLIFFSSSQYILFFLIFLLINLLFLFLFDNENVLKNYFAILKTQKTRIAVLFSIFFAIFIVFFHSHIAAILTGNFLKANREILATQNKIYLKEFILPNPFLKILLADFLNSKTISSIENVVFIGFLEPLLFLAFLITFPNSRKKYLILSNFLFFFILSLGFNNPDLNISLPYRFIYRFFPFEYIPESGRFYVIFYLFLTTGVVCLLKSIEKRKTLLFLILALVILERIPSNYYLSHPYNDKFAKVVQNQPGKAVFDIPINFDEPIYDVLPIVYKKKVLSGNFHWSADSLQSRSFVLNNQELLRFLCRSDDPFFTQKQFMNPVIMQNEEKLNQSLLTLLAKNDIKLIVLHRDIPFKLYDYYNCRNVWLRVHTLLPETLYVNPINTSKTIGQEWPISQVNLQLFFPYDGSFIIDKIDLYTTEPTQLESILNNNPIILSENRSFEVKKGSFLMIKSTNIFEKGYIRIWYRYLVNENIILRKEFTNQAFPLEKIYQDKDKEIWKINL